MWAACIDPAEHINAKRVAKGCGLQPDLKSKAMYYKQELAETLKPKPETLSSPPSINANSTADRPIRFKLIHKINL